MNRKQQNEQFYASIAILGTKEHCMCDDCLFYATHITENNALVCYLQQIGLNPKKADEVWCYNTENGYKYYTVDFFEVYAEREETHIFSGAKAVIRANPHAQTGQLPHALCIEVTLKMK